MFSVWTTPTLYIIQCSVVEGGVYLFKIAESLFQFGFITQGFYMVCIHT